VSALLAFKSALGDNLGDNGAPEVL
jgi:hypothetical protein